MKSNLLRLKTIDRKNAHYFIECQFIIYSKMRELPFHRNAQGWFWWTWQVSNLNFITFIFEKKRHIKLWENNFCWCTVINTEQHIVLPFSGDVALVEADQWIQCPEALAVHRCGVEWCAVWCLVEWAFGKEKFIQKTTTKYIHVCSTTATE